MFLLNLSLIFEMTTCDMLCIEERKKTSSVLKIKCIKISLVIVFIKKIKCLFHD